MDTSAFMHVTEIIRDRLAEVLESAQTVRVGALDDALDGNAALALCLYRISICEELRNGGHLRPASASASEQFFEDAMPFDLRFLVTAGPASDGDDLEGLARLGSAMLALFGNPVLEDARINWEPVRLSFDSHGMEELGRVWSLFPTVNYRTSFAFLASPVWIDPEEARESGPPVVRQQNTWPDVGVVQE